MADQYRQEVKELIQLAGNGTCADCGDEDPSWASCTLGVFLCKHCAGVHRALGTTHSRIKSITLDNWDKDQVEVMRLIGNTKAKQKYEKYVPLYYQRPSPNCVDVLRREWIMGKYQRLEFTDPDQQSAYNCSTKTGVLWKLGRDRKQFASRKFVLSRTENKLCYYDSAEENGKKQQPKAEADLDFVNAVFAPDKIGNPYGLQITYFKNGSTRNLFVYADNSKDIVDWYMCIRAAKWERRRIAFPDRETSQLAEDLTKDFAMEGWLSKMGPKNEPFRRRWFTLDRRKLMYFEEPLNAFAKGEVFIGPKDSNYSVSSMADEGEDSNSQNANNSYCFTLHTPDRDFLMRAETQDDLEKWLSALEKVVELPLTPQDIKLAAQLVPKKSSGSFRLIKR